MKKTRKYIGVLLVLVLLSFDIVAYGAAYNKKLSFEDIFDTNFNMLANSVKDEIDVDKLMSKDLSIKNEINKPKILIIHSHSSETYEEGESVIDVGEALKKQLESTYKVSVLHDNGVYDVVNGVHTSVGAYERMEKGVKEILKANATVEVIIDLHRDGGVEPTAMVLNGVSTAQINIINGLSVDKKIGKLGSLKSYPNSYIQDNLALSTQLKCKSDELSPKLITKVKIREFRYSLHLLPKSLLVDIGNNKDSLEDAKNAVKPFADHLAEVLGLEKIQ